MKDTKPWYLSVTIIGSVVAVGATGLRMAGFDITVADQQVLTDTALNIAAIVGSLAAVYGRVKATRKVG